MDLKHAKPKTRYVNFETGRQLEMLCAGSISGEVKVRKQRHIF